MRRICATVYLTMMRTPDLSLCYGQRLAGIQTARRSRVADFRNAPHKLKRADPDGHILQLRCHITMVIERKSNP